MSPQTVISLRMGVRYGNAIFLDPISPYIIHKPENFTLNTGVVKFLLVYFLLAVTGLFI